MLTELAGPRRAARQASVRAFSQRGKITRGDTSGWVDTPEQRKAKEAQALLAAASDASVVPARTRCEGTCSRALQRADTPAFR
jgi:hypothetical protein